MDTDDNKNEVNEPAGTYGPFHGKRIRIFTSFEEAAEAEALAAAEKSPIQRLRDTVQLIMRVYGLTEEDLRNRKRSNRIKIIRYK